MKSLYDVQSSIQSKLISKESISVSEFEESFNETSKFTHGMRWNVYAYAIWERQLEAIELDFPRTIKLFGKEPFRKLLTQYLQANPSRYPSLQELSAYLAPYVRENPIVEAPWLADLIEFEFLLVAVEFCDEPLAGLASEKLALLDLFTPEQLRFVINPSLILRSFDYDITTSDRIPEKQKTAITISSQGDFEIVSTEELAILAKAQSRCTFLEVLNLFNEFGFSESQVFEVFQKWMQKRWVRDIELL